ncbi:hypothetical protein PIB30_045757 [Stylosanthes scabra]|uniref:Uncharacterized protein n=1 Tax=Stylosanthes scabra TaxID=79078 RepID=A0ABU6SH73_9FABA|nr:hypothetical protein [Stylosanthes scabra]
MGKINKNLEEQRADIANLNSNFLRHAVDSDARVEKSSAADKGKAPLEKDAAREPNADSNDERGN